MTLNILNRRTDSLLLLFHLRDVMAVRIFFISFSVFLASNNFFVSSFRRWWRFSKQ